MEDNDGLGPKTALPAPRVPVTRHKLLRITARSDQTNIPDNKASDFLVQSGLQPIAVGQNKMAYKGAHDEQGRFYVNLKRAAGNEPHGRFTLIRCGETETAVVLEGTVSDIDDGSSDRIILQVQSNNSAVTTGQIVVEQNGVVIETGETPREQNPPLVQAETASPAPKVTSDMLEQIRSAASSSGGGAGGGLPTGLLENLINRVRRQKTSPSRPSSQPSVAESGTEHEPGDETGVVTELEHTQTESKTETEEHMSAQLKNIRSRASEVFEISILALKDTNKRGEISRVRQAILSIGKELGEPNVSLLKSVGLSENTAPLVYAAQRRIPELVREDSDFGKKVNMLRTQFGLPPIASSNTVARPIQNTENGSKSHLGRPLGSKNRATKIDPGEPPATGTETKTTPLKKRKTRGQKGDIALERDLHLIFGIAVAPLLFKGETLDPGLLLKRAIYIVWDKKGADPDAIAGVFEGANLTVDDVNRAIVEIAGLVRKKDSETLALLEEAERLLGD